MRFRTRKCAKNCWAIAGIMQNAAKAEPEMWGPSIGGFGHYRCVNARGKEVDWMLTAFSPRKQNIVVYVLDGSNPDIELMSKLGKNSSGKGCVYIKRLSDVHLPTLKRLVRESVQRKIKSSSPTQHKQNEG